MIVRTGFRAGGLRAERSGHPQMQAHPDAAGEAEEHLFA